MHLITISHFISRFVTLFAVLNCHHMSRKSLTLLTYRETEGPAVLLDRQGTLVSDSQEPRCLFYILLPKTITWNPQITQMPKCILNTTMNSSSCVFFVVP